MGKALAALLFVCLACLPGSARAQDSREPPQAAPAPPPGPSTADLVARLAPEYRQWLQSVVGLMTRRELEYFLALREDYRRDAFMEAFWEPRDPDRRTPRNELRDRWEQYGSSSGGFPYGDPRFLLYLLNGPPSGWRLPDGRPVTRCFSRTKELEIWYYEGSELSERRFAVIFQRTATANAYEVYLPGGRLNPLQRSGGLPVQDVRLLCAEELLSYTAREMQRVAGYDRLLKDVLSPPLPSPEWLDAFRAGAAELPADAETFEIELSLDFPARNQSRTAVRGMLTVPRDQAPGRRFDGELFHDFLLVGEVIRDGGLFESFRYRFEGPTPEEAAGIPLGFTRYIRPGTATLRLLLEDVYGNRYARVVREVEVPSPEGLPSVSDSAAPATGAATGPSLRLIPPAESVLTGKVRFRASTADEFEKVTFYLDDKPVLSKRRPPFSVELDLGTAAEPHRVRVVGFVDGREAATDQLWLNQGARRFRVRLIEPRAGGIYPGSVTARVEVDTPDGNPPDRLDVYLDDEVVATLREPPFTQSLRLSGTEAAVVRAVAYLADGTASEDAVLVNTSPFTESVEVRLVEVPTLVTDSQGRAITGLAGDRFRLFVGGHPRTVERFEETADAPIHTALLLDRSASMAPHLDRVAEAARVFATAALRTPEDRVGVFSFADRVTVDAGFTGSASQVDRALAGLVSHGGTALYDSLVQALNNFSGATGQTALVVFTDGQDESSRLTHGEALEAARRAGVTLYAVGLEGAFPDKASRRELEELAAETGGRTFFLTGLESLAGSFDAILAELRSRYLLAFQPAPSGDGDELREIRVEVDAKDARVRARRGYYP